MNVNSIGIDTSGITNEENEYGGETLAALAVNAAGNRQDALEALLVAASHVAVHADGNPTNNMEIARQKLAAIIEQVKEKHSICLEDLKAQGHQHDEVH